MFVDQHRKSWTETLTSIAAKPLSLCPNFPDITRRWEAWWHFKADRPLVCASVRKQDAVVSRRGKAFDLLDKPHEWLAVQREQLAATTYIGDAIPSIRVDIGPVGTGAFLGLPLHFAHAENTSWQTPTLDQWSDDAISKLDPNNNWLQMLINVASLTAADAAGNYLVSLPDFGGAIDILANMRGTENLLLDLYDNPQYILPAADKLVDAWEESFAMIVDAIVSRGAGVTSWLNTWSNSPHTVPSCDFNFMISKEQFQTFCLPSLARQARQAGRCVVHVDGPGASKHAESLAVNPDITALQYTCGAGTPSALAKLDMFKLIQSFHKPLVINCPLDELPQLVDKLDHRGLVFRPDWVSDMKAAAEILKITGAG